MIAQSIEKIRRSTREVGVALGQGVVARRRLCDDIANAVVQEGAMPFPVPEGADRTAWVLEYAPDVLIREGGDGRELDMALSGIRLETEGEMAGTVVVDGVLTEDTRSFPKGTEVHVPILRVLNPEALSGFVEDALAQKAREGAS